MSDDNMDMTSPGILYIDRGCLLILRHIRTFYTANRHKSQPIKWPESINLEQQQQIGPCALDVIRERIKTIFICRPQLASWRC